MTVSQPCADWIACPECDLIHRVPEVAGPHVARCGRCGAMLYGARTADADLPLALALAGLVLFALANAFPLLSFEMSGRVQANTLVSGVVAFWRGGFPELAVLVFATSVLLPLASLAALVYVLLPLRFGRALRGAVVVFRFARALRPWAMVEVYMLGVFVAMVKLADVAAIVPGTALYCFAGVIVATAAAEWTLDSRTVWRRLGAAR